MKSKKQSSHGEGFTRTKKQWESSIAAHLGKFIDRITLTDVINVLPYAIVAFFGARATRSDDIATNLGGASLGIISLKLASSNNLAAGTSGTITLAAIGMANPGVSEALNPVSAWNDAVKQIQCWMGDKSKCPP